MFRLTGRHRGKHIDFAIWICSTGTLYGEMVSLHCNDYAESLCEKAYCE